MSMLKDSGNVDHFLFFSSLYLTFDLSDLEASGQSRLMSISDLERDEDPEDREDLGGDAGEDAEDVEVGEVEEGSEDVMGEAAEVWGSTLG